MNVETRPRGRAPLADRKAREFLRTADPVLARLIDARPDFRPRAWMDELPPLDAFGTLVFQVAGQQLSVNSTRAIISRLQERFGGHMPSPAALFAADPQVLRESGFSARKGETLRALAERFVDGRLSDEALSRMTDDEVEATLTEVPGIGPWTARGFLLVALDRPDVFLSGDLALRRDPTGVRLRPPSERRGSGAGVGSLAAVSEPCGELPVRVRIRGATVTDAVLRAAVSLSGRLCALFFDRELSGRKRLQALVRNRLPAHDRKCVLDSRPLRRKQLTGPILVHGATLRARPSSGVTSVLVES